MRTSVYLRTIGLIVAGVAGGLATFIIHDGLLSGRAAIAQPVAAPAQSESPGSATAWLQLAVQVGTTYILQSRREACARGVKPIPPDMRRLLVQYFPQPLLDRVRYRVGQPTLASLPGLAFSLRHNDAITLKDVVVFRAARLAHDDVLWAHELQHVRQYQRWGVAGFMRRYIRDREAVEWAAYETQFNYRRAVHPRGGEKR